MASFFRKRIVHKVISLLQKRHNTELPAAANLLSSTVRVCRERSPEAQLFLPWKNVEDICKQVNISVAPTEVVKLLKNQGLPTAEGFLDIEFQEKYSDIIFTVDKHVFSKIVLHEICSNDYDLTNNCLFENIKKKNIAVLCSSPSIGELFSLTHFRHAIHTNFITNINRFVGHNVVKASHVNDWGLNAAIFLNGYKQFKPEKESNEEFMSQLLGVMKASSINYENDLQFRREADVSYQKMEQGDSKLLSEWQELRDLCMEHYDSVHKKIGVQFDDIFFDSSCVEESRKISDELLDKKIISDEDGCIKIVSPDDYMRNFPIQATEAHSTLYDFSRYLSSAVQMQKKHGFDSLYFVAPLNQKEFFQVLLAVLKKMDYPWANSVRQVNLMLITEYIKKRKRDSIESILEKIQSGMIVNLHENMQIELNESLQKMVDELSLASLIVYDTRFRRNADHLVDWREIVGFGNDSGAGFQLCYAGLKGLLEDSKYKIMKDTDTSALLEPEAHALIRHLARFDEMVYKAYFLLEPCMMYQFLLTLQRLINQAAKVLKLDIKEDKLRAINARMLLLSATLKIVEKAFYIVGIEPLKNVYSSKPFVKSS